MQFRDNAEVQTTNGQKVGRIDRVVIDPNSKEVTHLVVKKGFLFTKDKVVPIDEVVTASEDRVVLDSKRETPDDYPDFEETHYIPAKDKRPETPGDDSETSKLAWYYPMPRAAWWRLEMGSYPGYGEPPYVRRTDRNIPEGKVPLEEGAKVLSKDGSHVGDVERVFTDEDEQRVTHLLIAKGLLSKSRKLIPSMWVDTVTEKRVRLSVDEILIDHLPQFPEQAQG
jgi:uncharacterized protein YrrD